MCIAGLVADPLLVDRLAESRQDAEDVGSRASMRMAEPTASMTSIDSVERSSQGRALKA